MNYEIVDNIYTFFMVRQVRNVKYPHITDIRTCHQDNVLMFIEKLISLYITTVKSILLRCYYISVVLFIFIIAFFY